jgi:hypothetical protein
MARRDACIEALRQMRISMSKSYMPAARMSFSPRMITLDSAGSGSAAIRCGTITHD